MARVFEVERSRAVSGGAVRKAGRVAPLTVARWLILRSRAPLGFACLTVLLAALFLTQAQAQQPAGTVMVSPKDFPTGVERGTRDRVTRYRFSLGPDGAVTDCRVIGRSGEPGLDVAGCDILRTRARMRLRYGHRIGTIRFVWAFREEAEPRNGPGAPIPINFQQSVFWNDYPSTALRFNRGGNVLYEADISENGVPIACRVTGSSGTPALDERACALVMSRGAFIAASDGHGGRRRGLYRGGFTWQPG